MEAQIYITARLRKSPYFARTLAAGATTVSVYNKTYLVGGFSTPEAEFWSLVKDVALWDVTCQRIVEISGPDALAFTQYLTPRDLSRCQPGQCRYVLITAPDGGILNDPVLLRLAEDRFWLSRADSDILMWARGVAVNAGFDVAISEPDVATLQLQGPKSIRVLEDLIGPAIHDLGYYRLIETEVRGLPLVLARTGWSAERGYELTLLDTARGPELWDLLMATGKPYGIAPGSPSRIRRIEAGILDYSVDMDATTNPFEVGLERLVNLESGADFIGKAALRRLKAEGPSRRLVGLEIDGDPVAANDVPYPVLDGEAAVGRMTSWVHSPRLQKNIGLAMVSLAAGALGSALTVESDQGPRTAEVVALPFLDPERHLSRD